MAMLRAYALALTQLADPRVLRNFLKSLAVTLLLFVVLGLGAVWAVDRVMAWAGFDEGLVAGAGDIRQLLAALGVLAAGVLLWRVLALAVLQLFADEVVQAVEARHYPAAAAKARKLGWHEELGNGLKGAARALLVNLIALPFALVLLVTGVGAPLLFLAVNAVLLGRELQDMVWLRHRPAPTSPAPLSRIERWSLGGVCAVLLTLPGINLLAPFLGAAAAAHFIHRKDQT